MTYKSTVVLIVLFLTSFLHEISAQSYLRVKINGDQRVYNGSNIKKEDFSGAFRYWSVELRKSKYSTDDSFVLNFPEDVESGDAIVLRSRETTAWSTIPSLEASTEISVQYKDIYGTSYICSRDTEPVISDDYGYRNAVAHAFEIQIQEWNSSTGKVKGTFNGYLQINSEDRIDYSDGIFEFTIGSSSSKRKF